MIRSLSLLAALWLGFIFSVPAEAANGPTVDQSGWPGRKQFVQLPNGIRMAYVELGDPKGPPLLLLHGWTDTSRSWTILAPQFAGHRILIPDQRGHGASDAPDCCYAISSFAEDARLFLDAMGVNRAAVAGHSLGSMVAMALAAEHPVRVGRLVLIGSTALVPISRGDWLWRNVSTLQFPLQRDSDFIRAWTALSSPTPIDAAFLSHAVPETLEIRRHVWTGVMRELAGTPAGRHAVDISAPVLILAGGRDELFGAAHQAALRKAIPQAQFRLFPELGHNLLWERPHEVGPAIHAFLASSRGAEQAK